MAGRATRYDGQSRPDAKVIEFVERGGAVPVCPEALGGLPIPRPPVMLCGGDGAGVLDGTAKALEEGGLDRTEALVKGAREALRVAERHGIKKAVLKDGSPSCGITYFYSPDGRISGRGVMAELLRRNAIEVLSVDSL